jgi:hypothetical protein
VYCAALSDDGRLLITGCNDYNAYVWDIHTILKEIGLDDLLSNVSVNTSPTLILKVFVFSHQKTNRKCAPSHGFLIVECTNLQLVGRSGQGVLRCMWHVCQHLRCS